MGRGRSVWSPLSALFLLARVVASLFSAQDPIVQTSYGVLKGYADEHATQVFKAVPFAAPPLGELRFAPPVEPQKWRGVRNATQYNAACMSKTAHTSSPQKNIDEDCLYLAVFTSLKCRTTRDCPVMVYYHGGNFYYDSAVMFNDTHIINHYAKKDVLFVIPAFRLGIFGLIQLGDLVPPNLALYDIHRSLQFVHDEIHAFGGDPNQVTVIGHSGGGFLATALAFSRRLNADAETRLFRRTINLSGPMGFAKPQAHSHASQVISTMANCGRGNSTVQEQLACLRRVPALELLQFQKDYEDQDPGSYELKGFVPGGEYFDEYPYDILHRDKPPVDMFIASAVGEFPGSHIADNMGWKLAYRHPHAVDMKYASDARHLDLGESGDNQELFAGQVEYAREAIRGGSTVYLMSLDDVKLATHTSLLYYAVGVHRVPINADEKVIMSLFTNYLVNYARTGVPTDDWKSMKIGLDNYYSLDVKLLGTTRPTNKLYFRKTVVDYWLREMVLFDAIVPSITTRNGSVRTAELGAQSSTLPSLSFPSFALVLIAALLVLNVALFTRSKCWHLVPTATKRSEVGERTPLIAHKSA